MLVVLVLVSFAIIGADFAAISTGPMRALGIPYTWVLDYSPLIASISCFVLWVVLRQVVPKAAGLIVIAICGCLIWSIPPLAGLYVAEIPVARELTKEESASLVSGLGIKTTWRNSSQHGQRIFVAREHEAAARDELRTLGILR